MSKHFRERRRMSLCLFLSAAALLSLAPAHAQNYNSFSPVLASGGMLFEVSSTAVTNANYSSLTSAGGTYSVGFDGTLKPIKLTFSDGSYLNVYGIRGVYLVDDVSVSATHTNNTIHAYAGSGNSDADTTHAWDVDNNASEVIGYATPHNGYPADNNNGGNWLAYTPNGSITSANANVTKTWNDKGQYGEFTFTNIVGGLSSVNGVQLGLDVYGERYSQNGQVDTGWGGTGRVRISGFVPNAVTPEGSGLALLLVGLLPVCGAAMQRRRKQAA